MFSDAYFLVSSLDPVVMEVWIAKFGHFGNSQIRQN